MTDYEKYMAANEGSPFLYILGRDGEGGFEFLGDLTLLNDGTAIVNNDYDGTGNRYFDTYDEALGYVHDRICRDAILYDPATGRAVTIERRKVGA